MDADCGGQAGTGGDHKEAVLGEGPHMEICVKIKSIIDCSFFLLRRGLNQLISLLHGWNNACEKVVTKNLINLSHNSKTNINVAKKNTM